MIEKHIAIRKKKRTFAAKCYDYAEVQKNVFFYNSITLLWE